MSGSLSLYRTSSGVAVLLILAIFTGASIAATDPYRGTYIEVDGAGFFQRCASSQRIKVGGDSAAAELSAIYAALVGTPSANKQAGLYVELRARPGPRGSLLVSGLERVIKDDGGCRDVLRKSLFKAFGVEPNWHLFIDDTGLRWRTLSDGVLMSFPLQRQQRRDDVWIFESENPTNPTKAIHVELRHLRCIEPISGGRYSYEARINVGDRQYSGCAYPGSLYRGGRL